MSGVPRRTGVPRAVRMASSFWAAAAMVGLDRGDLAHPALLPGFLKPVGEVGVDPLQPR